LKIVNVSIENIISVIVKMAVTFI